MALDALRENAQEIDLSRCAVANNDAFLLARAVGRSLEVRVLKYVLVLLKTLVNTMDATDQNT